jgi:Transcriptional regulator, AbiEi antitoxin
MSTELPRECLRLLKEQDGVITLGQAVSVGLTAKSVRTLIRANRWQVMHRGVYAAFAGKPTRRAELWAAVLRAGTRAVLSHQTAAELWGLVDGTSPVIHVTVPHDDNPERRGPIAGVVIHRSRSLQRARHPVLTPPRTRVEETVLDLIECARTFDEKYSWICRAIGRRRTTAQRIRAALDARARIQQRFDIELALGYAGGGALSILEFRYVRGVESAHGLPVATRQARIRHATGNRYLDNLYPEYRACVEIDGAAAHPEDEQWRDKRRDRWNAVHEGIDTIRIGVPDLVSKERQCRTAADVTKWFSARGRKVGHSCGPGCPVELLGVLKALIWVLSTPNLLAPWLVGLRDTQGVVEVGGG